MFVIDFLFSIVIIVLENYIENLPPFPLSIQILLLQSNQNYELVACVLLPLPIPLQLLFTKKNCGKVKINMTDL